MRAWVTIVVGVTAAAMLAASCTPPGSNDGERRSGEQTMSRIDSPVTRAQVRDLGEVTLEVWADAGEEAVLERVVPEFEKKYPNISVDVTIKGWTDLMGTVINAMDSPSAPDVAQTNQGYATMGTLVKAGLLRPLDDVRAAYDLDQVPDSAWESSQWRPDGSAFGEGPVYGIGMALQTLGVYYNRDKLDQLGLDPPTDIDEFEDALEKAARAGEVPIMLGNAEQYPLGAHVLGILADVYEDPDRINAWIRGTEDATVESKGFTHAAETLKAWQDRGYLGSGYNGRSLDDAISDYARGDGVFYMGGSFAASTIAGIHPDRFGFTTLQNQQGNPVATGGFGTPWSISSQTDVEPAAAAFLGFLASEQAAPAYAADSRLPAFHLSQAQSTGRLHADQLHTARKLFADGDLVGYLDWASPTMQSTLGAGAQRLLDGKITVSEFLADVQSDWDAYQSKHR